MPGLSSASVAAAGHLVEDWWSGGPGSADSDATITKIGSCRVIDIIQSLRFTNAAFDAVKAIPQIIKITRAGSETIITGQRTTTIIQRRGGFTFKSETFPKGTETPPTGITGGKPTGHPVAIPGNEAPENVRSLTRQNETADLLARQGYKVNQNPVTPGNKNPDYTIEGKVFDCYAPSSPNTRNIADRIRNKVASGQTDRVVLNMNDTPVGIGDMRKQLTDWPISGLREVIVVRGNTVIQIWP